MLLVVSAPSTERDDFLDPDGVLGRRFADQVRRHGWVLPAEQLSSEEIRALDRRRAEGRDDLVLSGPGEEERALYLGPSEGGVLVRAHGKLGVEDPLRDLEDESRTWLDHADRLRWEEVVEFAHLLPEENLAIRNLALDSSGLGGLKAAFLRDKRAANLALYLMETRAPRVMLLSLHLPAAQAELARDLALGAESALPIRLALDAEQRPSLASLSVPLRETADGRFFVARMLAAGARVAGRCDRIYQSLAAGAPRGSWIVIDARDAAIPFVAVLRAGARLGPASERGNDLLEALTRDQ